MSETTKKSNNTMVLLIAGAAIIVLGLGGYFYQKNQSDTVSVSIGGKTLSATVKH